MTCAQTVSKERSVPVRRLNAHGESLGTSPVSSQAPHPGDTHAALWGKNIRNSKQGSRISAARPSKDEGLNREAKFLRRSRSQRRRRSGVTAPGKEKQSYQESGAHPSPVLQVPSPVPGLGEVVDWKSERIPPSLPKAQPGPGGSGDPSPGHAALGQRKSRAKNKEWGARPSPTAPHARPLNGTPAGGRTSLATQSRGRAAAFIPTRAGGHAPREGNQEDAREEWDPGRPRTPRRADRLARARLPANTCARCVPRELATAGNPPPSPYPPATGVGAPRAAGPASGHS